MPPVAKALLLWQTRTNSFKCPEIQYSINHATKSTGEQSYALACKIAKMAGPCLRTEPCQR